MTDTMLPILRQMHNADDDRARALILLQVSDAVLMKYREVFEAACRRAGFEGGLAWIDIRRAAFLAVRGPDGRLNNPLFEQARQDFAAFAGTPSGEASKADWPSDIAVRPSAASAAGSVSGRVETVGSTLGASEGQDR